MKFIIALMLAFVAATGLAQQTNSLDVLKQTCEKQKLILVAQYGKALDATLADLKRKGDLDNVLVLQEELKRFDTEGLVPAPADAKDSFRPAATAYCQSMATLMGKYTRALETAIKEEVAANRIEEAKAIKAERDKAVIMMTEAQAKLPPKMEADKPKADKETAPVNSNPQLKEPVGGLRGSVRDRRLCDKQLIFTPSSTLRPLAPNNEMGQTMIAAQEGKPFKAVTRGAMVLADKLAGCPDVFCTHPPTENVPALIDFSKLTSKKLGKLTLSFLGHPSGDGCRVVVKVQGKEFETIEVSPAKWSTIDVPFKQESLVVMHYPTGWSFEYLFTTYAISD